MKSLNRWRLVLGKYAQQQLASPLSAADARIEAALDFLYSREYKGRNVREYSPTGSLDPSQLEVPTWLNEVRELFPRETVEVIEKHALDRYGLSELVTDKEVLEKLTPNMDLLKTLLTFRGSLSQQVPGTARRIIQQVVEEIKRKLEAEVRRAFSGRINRFRHSPQKVAQNLLQLRSREHVDHMNHTLRKFLRVFRDVGASICRQGVIQQGSETLRVSYPVGDLALDRDCLKISRGFLKNE